MCRQLVQSRMRDRDRLPVLTVDPKRDPALSVGRGVGATGLVVEPQRGLAFGARPRLLGRATREDLGRRCDALHAGNVGGADRLEQGWPIVPAISIGKGLADLLFGGGVVALAEL